MTDPRYPSSKEVEQFHRNADTDGSAKAVHHTLGSGQSQAAPGNHTHTGGDSVTLDRLLEAITISGSNRGGSAMSKLIAALVSLGATDTSTDDNSKMPLAAASGSGSFSVTAINTPQSTTVNLPAGKFSAPPDVTVSSSASTGANKVGVSVTNITATDFKVWCYRTDVVGNVSFTWIAMQTQ